MIPSIRLILEEGMVESNFVAHLRLFLFLFHERTQQLAQKRCFLFPWLQVFLIGDIL